MTFDNVRMNNKLITIIPNCQGGVKREGEREGTTAREPPALVKKPKLSTSPKYEFTELLQI